MAQIKRRSLNKTNPTPKRPSLRERRRNKRYLAICLVFLIVAGAVFGASRFSRTESFRLSKIEVVGALTTDENKLEKIVKETVSGNYLAIFSKAMTYIIPRDDIKANVLGSLPTVKNINLNVVNKDEIEIIVEERDPHAIMCSELDSLDNCYLTDSLGFVYKKLEEDEKNVLSKGLVSVILPGISEKYIGTTPISEERYIDLINFVNDGRSNGVDGYAVTESLGREHTMYVRNENGFVTKVFFNERESLGRQIENLVLFYKQSKKGSIYEYIDLRFGNNIIFKEVDGVGEL